MSEYPFRLIRHDQPGPLEDTSVLIKRPFTKFGTSFAEDARRFVPGEQLEVAINTSIAVGEPLLVTGEPGTGKTQAAYYIAYKLNIEPVIHFQVKSGSSSHDLLYHFDTVRYFHDAHFQGKLLKKGNYVEPGPMWQAIKSDKTRVLLIDEIDKAPRDFPNDLLFELDKMQFTVPEIEETITAPKENRPIVIITSNSERRLPEPFLRRCVYHRIQFDDDILVKAIENRKEEYSSLSPEFLRLAVQRFLALRDVNLRKQPATGEFLVWLRVLALAVGTYPDRLNEDLSKLPYLGVLLKDHQDMEDVVAAKSK